MGILATGQVVPDVPPVLTGPPESLRRSPVVKVVEQSGPAVVGISADMITQRGNPFSRFRGQDFFDFFGGRRRRTTQSSRGSGVIIDASGLVLTNEHVVSGAANIVVTLPDRRKFEAEVVGADANFDIAVLRLTDADNLPVVPRGGSDDLMPGEPVVEIGNPFGRSNTVTTGVVSALHRSLETEDRAYEDFIQTDAAINPGNSGGALLNIEGKLIGINTAIHASGSGIGFAIPVDRAMAVVDEVLSYGEVRPAFVGLLVDLHGTPGAEVIAVHEDSPGEQAGFRRGDRIIDVGGQEVRNGRAFRKLVHGFIPGRAVRVTFLRGDSRKTVTVNPEELDPKAAMAIGKRRLGLEVQLKKGYLVISRVDPKSDAAQVGLKRGDILEGIAGHRLRSVDLFEQLCAMFHDHSQVSVYIGRRGRWYNVRLALRTDVF